MQPMMSCGGVEQIRRMAGLRHIRWRNHSIRPHKNPVRSDLSPADARHADDLPLGLKAQKLYERFLYAITPDNVHARFGQEPNGRCAGPRQHVARKLKVTLLTVALRNNEVMPPILPFGLSLQAVLMRPRHRIDPILADAHRAAGEQRIQSAATRVVVCFDKRSLRRRATPTTVYLDICSRYVPAHVLAIFRIPLKPFLEIAFDPVFEMRTRKFPPEFGRADGALRQDISELIGVPGNVLIRTRR